jgi:hypothetical protein
MSNSHTTHSHITPLYISTVLADYTKAQKSEKIKMQDQINLGKLFSQIKEIAQSHNDPIESGKFIEKIIDVFQEEIKDMDGMNEESIAEINASSQKYGNQIYEALEIKKPAPKPKDYGDNTMSYWLS